MYLDKDVVRMKWAQTTLFYSIIKPAAQSWLEATKKIEIMAGKSLQFSRINVVQGQPIKTSSTFKFIWAAPYQNLLRQIEELFVNKLAS